MFLFCKIDDFELGAASHFLELFAPVMIEGAWFVDNNFYELALLNSQHLLFIAPPYLGLHDVKLPLEATEQLCIGDPDFIDLLSEAVLNDPPGIPPHEPLALTGELNSALLAVEFVLELVPGCLARMVLAVMV